MIPNNAADIAPGIFGPEHRLIWLKYADTLRPPPDMLPDEFSLRYRKLHREYCSESPGDWPAEKFPCQAGVMNAVARAIREGKRGIVHMKPGQGGGTDAAINALCWLKIYYPGPQLFLTSTEGVAEEFGRERFQHVIRDMPPLAAKRIPGREVILIKRFTDGKILLSGGRSIFKLQSTPYRIVAVDELDSLVENLGGQGDPIKLAEIRTDSYGGPTLIFAYAHPSSRDRGAAKLFYESSDQERPFVVHPSCGKSLWFQWEQVKVVPKPGQTQEAANYDPDCYAWYCPNCGEIMSDGERVAMMRAGIDYRSTLPPEEAAKKDWIGVSSSQFYTPSKTVHSFAKRWIGTDCGANEAAAMVFWNKVAGEPYEPKIQKIDIESLRSLVIVSRRKDDPEFYQKGSFPPAVQFITAGQDSREKELHWSIWGWGVRRDIRNATHLCGWLLDWGVKEREKAKTFTEEEYHFFDTAIYRKVFTCTVGTRTLNVRQCGHDVSYEPTQLPILRYCRHHPGRAIPVRGASLTHSSATTARYVRWGNVIRFRAGEHEKEDTAGQQLILNTFMLKTDWYGWTPKDRRIEIPDIVNGEVAGTRKVGFLTFPEDVDDAYLEQSKNEELRRGKKKNERVWAATGANHWGDTNIYSHGLALNLEPFGKGRPADETPARRRQQRKPPGDAHDPSMW